MKLKSKNSVAPLWSNISWAAAHRSMRVFLSTNNEHFQILTAGFVSCNLLQHLLIWDQNEIQVLDHTSCLYSHFLSDLFFISSVIWGSTVCTPYFMQHTVVLIKLLPYSGATAQTRSAALWGVLGSYGQAPAQQGMSGLVRETSHL